VLAAPAAHAGADRILRVVAAPDEEFLGRPGWEGTLRTAVQDVSDRMEIDFGLRLRVSRIVPWQSNAPDYDMSALREELKRNVEPDSDEDIVVGFCGRTTPTTERREMRLGQSDTPGRAIAVSDVAGRDLALVLRHELAHAFGVPHVTQVTSIMNPDLRGTAPLDRRPPCAQQRPSRSLPATPSRGATGCCRACTGRRARNAYDLLAAIGESYHARGQNDGPAPPARAELIRARLTASGRRQRTDEERYADAVQS
jgi:hypothetical protein